MILNLFADTEFLTDLASLLPPAKDIREELAYSSATHGDRPAAASLF